MPASPVNVVQRYAGKDKKDGEGARENDACGVHTTLRMTRIKQKRSTKPPGVISWIALYALDRPRLSLRRNPP